MVAGGVPEKVLESVDEPRRAFLRKLVLGSAFVVPSVASFSMAGLAVGEAATLCSNQTQTEIVALTVNPTGTILPGGTAVTITGTIICDSLSTVTFNFMTVTQTGRKTQFINAIDAPTGGRTVTCGPNVTTWTSTSLITPTSGLLHKGKAGVQVQFDDCLGADPA